MIEFDDLNAFAQWFLSRRPMQIPVRDALSFYETAAGIVLYRQAPYQVQLFIAFPSVPIIEHMHPNVDAVEVYLHDMEFTHLGQKMIDRNLAEAVGPDERPLAYGAAIRIKPTDAHAGVGGKNGGAFLSIQKWLNGVQPTCVAKDWKGAAMGPAHKAQILTRAG